MSYHKYRKYYIEASEEWVEGPNASFDESEWESRKQRQRGKYDGCDTYRYMELCIYR